MKRSKRIITLLLALVMILTMVPVPVSMGALADDDPITPDMNPQLQVFLDQRRQEVDGFVLSGAFRQIDHLLNGFADNPEMQWEVLDLIFGHHTGYYPYGHPRYPGPVDPAARGIGLSIWRNQMGDKAELWNYIWRQPPSQANFPGQMAGGGGNQSWGRWYDTAAFSFRPFHPHDPDHYYGLDLPMRAEFLDDASYRWWFDAHYTAAESFDPAHHDGGINNPRLRDTTHVPTIEYPLGRPVDSPTVTDEQRDAGFTGRLNDNIAQIDRETVFMFCEETGEERAFEGWQVREGGPQGNDPFDIFDWPIAPGDQNIVYRDGRSPVDRGQVWASRMAMAYAEGRGEEMKIMAAGWSGPAWVKSTGRVNGGHVVNAEWALEAYATFLADYLQGWETIYGAPVWGLSLSNEPDQFNHVYSKSGWAFHHTYATPGTVDFGIRMPMGLHTATLPAAATPDDTAVVFPGLTTAFPTWNAPGGAGSAPAYMPFARDFLGPIMEERGLRTVAADGTIEGVRLQMGDSQSYTVGPNSIWRAFWGNSAEQFIDDYVFHTYGWSHTGGYQMNTANLREWKVRAQMDNRGKIMSEISTMSGQTGANIFDYRIDALRSQNGTASRSDMGSALAWAMYWNRQMSVAELTGTGQWWAVGFKRPEREWPMRNAPGDQSLENLIYITNDARGHAAPVGAGAAGAAQSLENPATLWGGIEGTTGSHRGVPTPGITGQSNYGDGQLGGYFTEQTFDYRVHSVFWALGHFSKFARPGWFRVNIDQTPIFEAPADTSLPAATVNNLNLQSSAYISPEADADGYYDFAVTIINGTRQNQTLDLSFPGFTVESIDRWETREDALCPTLNYQDAWVRDGGIGVGGIDLNTVRRDHVRGWFEVDGELIRGRDEARSLMVPTASNSTPSMAGSPLGNGMVLHGEVTGWTNGGEVTVPFVSMTTFVGRARVNPNDNLDATQEIPFFYYNELEGAAINNNNTNLQDPRVETMRIPRQDFEYELGEVVITAGQAGAQPNITAGFTNNTYARFTFNNLDLGAGVDTLTINAGGAIVGTATGDAVVGRIPARAYIDGELATERGAHVVTTNVAANVRDSIIPLSDEFDGVADVVIVLGAQNSPVVGRLNSLSFSSGADAAAAGVDVFDVQKASDLKIPA
ncbi:MAG: hypothetical protein FWE28_09835 [Oscillospiraceae bacterium]|nr:hypothetical protein [Oscillospiraceae bacterium]